jgi:hypothetical protein
MVVRFFKSSFAAVLALSLLLPLSISASSTAISDEALLADSQPLFQIYKIPPPQQPPMLAFPFIPDSQATPGSLCSKRDPDYKQDRYAEKIPYCGRNVASSLKRDIYDDYGISSKCRKEYTIDHFIPLAIGGSNRRDNLWPEHKSVKALRQNLEMDLYNEIRNGTISQAEALKIIVEAKLNPPVQNPSEFDFCQ